jgi:hypothetical protein
MARFLRFFYLLRFPILSGALLAGVLPFMYELSLFRGFADLAPLSVATVSLVAFMGAAALMVNANVIFLYGEYRLTKEVQAGSMLEAFLNNEDGTASAGQQHLLATRGFNPPYGRGVCAAGMGLYLVFLILTFHKYPFLDTPRWWMWWLYALIGFAVGVLIVLGVTWWQIHETKPLRVAGAPNPIAGPFLVFPFQRRRRLHAFLHTTAFLKSPWTRNWRLGPWLARRFSVRGYAFGNPPDLLPGHMFAIALWVTTLAIHGVGYVLGVFGFTTWNEQPDSWTSQLAPTLAYVVALVVLFCWTTSGMSFFFDGYPFPSMTVLLVFLLGLGLLLPNDHTFALDTSNSDSLKPRLATLGALTGTYLEGIRKKPRIVVVATAGGGIQAAGWTTQVLNELTRAIPEFRSNTVALSSISGGSVGVYMYETGTARLRGKFCPDVPCGPPLAPGKDGDDPCTGVKRNEGLRGITCAAMDSGLESAGWGLVHPDLSRMMTGLPWGPDRGTALERSMAVHAARAVGWTGRYSDANTSAALSSYVWHPEPDKFPVLLINSTSVESGKPVVFSNSSFAAKGTHDEVEGIASFHSMLENADVAVPTAVRMSATFPYVSPAARAKSERPTWHLMDGGYYDNYGVATALHWLDQAGLDAKTTEVLLLRIESFPLDTDPNGKLKHWPFQFVAPIATLLSARSSAQQTRASDAIKLYRRSAPNFHAVMFRFNPPQVDPDQKAEDAPLSWHLAAKDKNNILKAWGSEATCVEYVKGFLNPNPNQTVQEPGIECQ